MNEQIMQGVARRLDRLERENRLLKSIVFLVCVGVAAVAALGQGEPKKIPKELAAENFVLRSPNGMERGRLGTSPDGKPYLVLLASNGQTRIALGDLYGHISRTFKGRVYQYGVGPGPGLYDKDGKPRKTANYSAEEALQAQQQEPAESLFVLFDQRGNVSYAVP